MPPPHGEAASAGTWVTKQADPVTYSTQTSAHLIPRVSSSPISSSLTSSSCSTAMARSTWYSRCPRLHRAGRR